MCAKTIEKMLPTPLVMATFIIGFIALFCAPLPILGDPDIGWHIAAGDLIRHTLSVPEHDVWSYSGSIQTWYNISWLWDVGLSATYQWLGVSGLYIVALLLPALLLSLLVASLQSRPEFDGNAIIFVAFITLFTMVEYAQGRPQVMGLFLALAFHHILHASRKKIYGRTLFLLPLLMVLWVNVHGSFIVGFVVLGAYGLEALFARNMHWFWRLVLIGVLCLCALPINPYGIHIIDAVLRTLNSVVTQYIKEWQPFIFGNVIGASLWLLVFIFAGNLRGSNAPLADKMLVVLWLLAMLYSTRNIGFLAILGAPYIAANLPVVDKRKLPGPDPLAYKHYSWALLAAVPFVVGAAVAALPYMGEAHYVQDPKTSPAKAIDFVMKHYPKTRVMNDYDLGGRIIFQTRGRLAVFIDGRSGTVYDEKILKDALDFYTMENGWEKVLDKYHAGVILVGPGHGFAKAYEHGEYHRAWRKAYADDAAIVYVRTSALK